ncbi:YgfZ/GcvT domain-containing protein [Extensimonas sp. H3M7-6]|uniref:CAF17-like 4Fe-4S cluster assembly/insertion protein YgfZ n=1 Tax=Extensimonas soli TaxID=3031322 RepID=UPI0023DBAE9B|nr:folate-binding protein [Extensimonas sp. H3M7-6]MDF1481278.1 folate-binding protein [Extensimonas sp. H3M7-6]
MPTDSTPPDPSQLLHGVAPIAHLGVLRAQGEDAAAFLHAQLTQDFVQLDAQHARLAAFLSAKGRMQASFIGLQRSATEVLLLCSRDLLAPTLKRLSMFVLRAKVRLSDATAEFALYGLAGSAVETIAGSVGPAWAKADFGSESVVHLYPALGQPRALWVGPADAPAPAGPALDAGLWLWSEVRSGVATLSAPVVDLFVPQMLNYESVGGVNFHKGCYPGQEVVARSQYRGTLKRRAYLAHADAPIAVAAEIFAASDPEQPCGTVVQVAAAPGGGVDAIVCLQTAAAEQPLHVPQPEGQPMPLTLLPLPYPLLEEV